MGKNNEIAILNGLVDFVKEMETIMHEGASALYRSKERYPIDGETLLLMARESLALFDADKGLDPTPEQASLIGLGPLDLEISTMETKKYRGKPKSEMLELFVNKITRIVETKAFQNAECGLVLAPDYRSFIKRIDEYLNQKMM
jgi:hypothetical protein